MLLCTLPARERALLPLNLWRTTLISLPLAFPSEYIFKTQCASLRREYQVFPLQNVAFMTYARLIQITQEEVSTVHADHI